MNCKKQVFFLFVILTTGVSAQTLRGLVTDAASGTPMPYVTISIADTRVGTTTGNNGEFTIENLSVGRHTVQVSFIGYETSIIKEVLVTSAKEVFLEISLRENVQELNEVTIRPVTDKSEAMNKMALTGARLLSVEEASRYMGSIGDPSRVVGFLAGVSPSVSNNGISIHGNAPHLLQWRLEDVEIPNPNHFADIATLGGGILSSLSTNVLGNSDFFTGAFPAEYNNAVSGIFDMKLRNGNNQKFQNTFQLGVLGIDFASEGPLGKKNNSSYIFNYRYSTTGLMSKIVPSVDLGGVMDYQDINFKFNFPTRNSGTFSIWGTGLIDKFESDLEEIEDWKYYDDGKLSNAKQYMGAGGLSHRYYFGNDATLKTTLAVTHFKQDAFEEQYTDEITATPYMDMYRANTNIVLTSTFNHKLNSRFTNRTGFTYTKLFYNMDFNLSPVTGEKLEKIARGKGNTDLLSAYYSSAIALNDRLLMTLGINGQFLTLNNNHTIEPRAAIKWQTTTKSSLALAYGLNSRMEKPDVYFVTGGENNNNLVNKNLDFTKSHHLMLTYDYRISDNINLKVEPYFQYLFNVPVVANSSYSLLNRTDFYTDETLVNEGKGRTYGVDLTVESYLNRGLHWMFTASLFDSKYKGGDDIWHNTRFNRNYILNGMIGKEWMLGRKRRNMLSAYVILTLQGGDRYSPVNEAATLARPDKEVQYDETKAYSEQLSPMFISHFNLSYKLNRKKVTHEFSIQSINATGYKEYFGHEYNIKTNVIEAKREARKIFNVSYKLDF